MKDANGRPIGIASDNPIMDSRMYEVKKNDGHTVYLAGNIVAVNLFAQFDQARNQFTILYSLTGTRTDGTQVLQQYSFVHISTGTKRIVNTTKGWYI